MCLPFAAISTDILFLSLLAVVVGWWLVMRLRRKAGVWRLRYYAFPRPWLKHLHNHVPHYGRLPWELRAPYQDKVLHFVDSKIFRPGGSMGEVTDELRVTIAGNACLLLLNSPAEMVFPTILTVQVYPLGDEDPTARSSAIAVLWDKGNSQATHPADRGNRALAEITATLGLKALPEPLLLTGWARVLCPDFERDYPGILEKTHSGDAGDVFAVATEAFLAAPAVLQQSQPALYDALRHFYRVDPLRWSLKK